ncbi:MAG: acyl-CoA thioesterase [Halobacteriota archaeon]
MKLPFGTDVQVRFRDLDTMGHVNNAVYVTFLEQARTAFFVEALEVGLHEVDTVIASLSIDYRAPIQLGADVRVGMAIGELGRSSVPMTYEIYADGQLAATAETVQVLIDRETESSRPIPDDWRETFESYQVS